MSFTERKHKINYCAKINEEKGKLEWIEDHYLHFLFCYS